MKLFLPIHLMGAPLLFLQAEKELERMFLFAAQWTEKGDLRVVDVLIPHQECYGAHVETSDWADDHEVIPWLSKLGREYEQYVVGWWHTHPNMGTTPSSDDRKTTSKYGAIMCITDNVKHLTRATFTDVGTRSRCELEVSLDIVFEGFEDMVEDKEIGSYMWDDPHGVGATTGRPYHNLLLPPRLPRAKQDPPSWFDEEPTD